MDTSETTQVLSIEMRPDEPEVQISQVEFDYYCTLFEEMLEEMETNEYVSYEPKEGVDFSRGFRNEGLDLDECLDEFDLAEIEQMKKDAEAHADDDRKQRELIDARNQAENTVYQIRKQLEEHGDKVEAEIRGNIESALNNLKEAAKGDDGEAIKRNIEQLGQASQELGKILYEEAAKQQAAAGGQPQPGADTGEGAAPEEGEVRRKDDDDVIDAEFESKD